METESFIVIWSEVALKDLETIYFFIAKNSIHAANAIIDDIYNKTRQLSMKGFSESGQIDDINAKYRRLIEGNYKILYSITENQIVIHGVFDCRQNPKKLKKK
ncbi:MAG: type II toxin-antitoxin system RelE/ParE family toxin [Bacteroidales bacterium]|nr:type II toxin-antitoxin system RelE/ParE family toxin [Bacteroidales bacterium]